MAFDPKLLSSFIQKAKEELREADPELLAHRCGCQYQRLQSGDGELIVPFLGRTHVVQFPSLEVKLPGHEDADLAWVQALFLHYLRTADGTPLVGEWVTLRDLPGGLLYEKASQGYCGDRLAQAFGNDIEGLAAAARQIGGKQEEIGDLGFTFAVLPRVTLAVAYWLGDEEFPPTARVLFDRAASHYVPTDALSVLGGMLCGQLIKARRKP